MLFYYEIEPRKDQYIADYRRHVETQLKLRLKFRMDILKRDWFRKRIQISFEARQKRFQENNAHVIIYFWINWFDELNISITETECSDNSSSDSMKEDSDDLNFIASEKEILKDAEEAAKLQKKDNDFYEVSNISEKSDDMCIDNFLYDIFFM